MNKLPEELPARRRSEEQYLRIAAEREMADRFANLSMPADIQERARVWGLSAWAEVLWNNAFQAGYREGLRDRNTRNTRD